MYKITFDMRSPVCYIDRPVFDGILAYCAYQKVRSATDMHTPTGKEVVDIDIPLELHESGFYLASYLYADAVEGTDNWKKRWHSRHDHMADFGKAKRRVHTGSGAFKSYNIPLVTQSASTVWFYFSGDADAVCELIAKYLAGFGKKNAIGFGWYDSFHVEEVADGYQVYVRPLPLTFDCVETFLRYKVPVRLTKTFGAYKIPYWLPENQTDIVVPEVV